MILFQKIKFNQSQNPNRVTFLPCHRILMYLKILIWLEKCLGVLMSFESCVKVSFLKDKYPRDSILVKLEFSNSSRVSFL